MRIRSNAVHAPWAGARHPATRAARVALAVFALGWPVATRADALSYAELDTVLVRHLHAGRVDYRGLRADPGPLRRFLALTREADPTRWTREAQIAFWVNVYNARVLDGVIRRPGLESVLDVGRILGIPTLAFFREKQRTAGRDLSLSHIEHRILRERFGEPRIHFVLNCASASCPLLPSRALRGDSLDAALRRATAAFLTDTTRNRVSPHGPLELSQIFKWYRGDFEAEAGSVTAYIARHWPGTPPSPLEDRPVRYLDYDWSLNGDW